MSKAKDLALEKYPKKIEWVGNQWDGAPFDVNSEKRFYYRQGYEEAEKDLELTIEDIERLHTFLYAIKHNKQGVFTFTRLSDEQYQKILKRYKDYKERKEKCQ
jgi:hypothetical protein